MRKVLLMGFLAILMSVETRAQTDAVPSSPLAPPEASPLQFDTAQSRQGAPSTARRVHRCCNLKGALIGAGIGAAIGTFYATLCDAGDCTLTYVKYMGIMGGIGAGLGAFVERRQGFGPLPERPVLLDDSREWSPFVKSRIVGRPDGPTLRDFNPWRSPLSEANQRIRNDP
jgi:hypothetical protein